MESRKPNIPPLKIVKSNSNIVVSNTTSEHESKLAPARFYSSHGQPEMTPPMTPLGATEHTMEQKQPEQQSEQQPELQPEQQSEQQPEPQDAPRAVFHNYLRAFYPFHPAGNVSPSTVTLPLEQGDIILVHSVHTNGWADGTLLDSGNRGWLPTNYCEAYDQLPMRPLLKALTDFWDIIRGGCGSSLKDFGNQDLMRGPIAGVRFLLVSASKMQKKKAGV